MRAHLITEFVDELDSLDSDEIFEWLAELRSLRSRLDAAELRAYRRLDRLGDAELDGARSTAGWVEHRTGVPAQTVRERLKVGRLLDSLPVIEKHFTVGDIDYSHVRALAAVHNPRTAPAMTTDEQFFVDQAKQLTVRDYIAMLRFWRARVDVGGAETSVKDLWESRRAWVAETLDGTVEASATFDAENGAIFHGVIQAITQELWEADQGAARAAGPDVVRTRSQLVADALVEMARRASQPAGKQARPLVHLVVDAATLQGRLGNVAITSETARRLCCDANLARVVTDPKSVIIDLGAARNPNDPLRHLLQARHPVCIWPGCTIAANYCQIHHIEHAIDGGPTRLENLAPQCAHHHRLLHEGSYTCRHTNDRTSLTFTRPDGHLIGQATLNPRLT